QKLLAAMAQPIRRRFRFDQWPPDGGAKMGRIQAAKNAVPVGVVALALQQQSFSVGNSGAEAGVATAGRLQAPNLLRYMQHFFMQQVRFGILAKKIAP